MVAEPHRIFNAAPPPDAPRVGDELASTAGTVSSPEGVAPPPDAPRVGDELASTAGTASSSEGVAPPPDAPRVASLRTAML